MNRGSIILTHDDQHEWIPLLKSIYQFESQRVSGPGSYHRDISDALWSIDDFMGLDPQLAEKRKTLTDLIGYLSDNGHMLVVPEEETESVQGSKTKGDRYLTRVGETVRLLGHTYEYWHKGRPGIEATRWLVDEKKMPTFSITAHEGISRLQGIVRPEPGFDADERALCKAIETVVRGTSSFLAKGDWTKARFSEFQIVATEEMLRSKFKRGHDRNTQILTAGVGSGKTIGFTMGMMISALYGLMTGEKKCHLFLYPRTALAKDQHQKLSKIAEEIDYAKLNVHLEHMEYYNSMKPKLSVKEGIKKTYTDWDYPILIVTTLETLKRRLQHPLFAKTMARSLSSVVLDEIHLIRDITGTKIVHLLERLKATVPRRILFTGSSATVASPERHAATVFGVKESDVRVIAPDSDQMAVAGLVHHVFLKPRDSMSILGLLVNGTSILTHTRRDDVGNRPDDVASMPKTIGFADNLDMLGRWNEDFRENERTEHDQAFGRSGRPHPQDESTISWNPRQRELPYALRFKDPLFRRLNAKIGKSKSDGDDGRYVKIDLDTKGINPCSECIKGKRGEV